MSTGLKSLSFALFNYLQSNQIQHVVQVHAFLESREQGIGPKEARKVEGIASIDWKGRNKVARKREEKNRVDREKRGEEREKGERG